MKNCDKILYLIYVQASDLLCLSEKCLMLSYMKENVFTEKIELYFRLSALFMRYINNGDIYFLPMSYCWLVK